MIHVSYVSFLEYIDGGYMSFFKARATDGLQATQSFARTLRDSASIVIRRVTAIDTDLRSDREQSMRSTTRFVVIICLILYHMKLFSSAVMRVVLRAGAETGGGRRQRRSS